MKMLCKIHYFVAFDLRFLAVCTRTISFSFSHFLSRLPFCLFQCLRFPIAFTLISTSLTKLLAFKMCLGETMPNQHQPRIILQYDEMCIDMLTPLVCLCAYIFCMSWAMSTKRKISLCCRHNDAHFNSHSTFVISLFCSHSVSRSFFFAWSHHSLGGLAFSTHNKIKYFRFGSEMWKQVTEQMWARKRNTEA